MGSILQTSIFTAALFLTFFALLLVGVRNRNRKMIYLSFVFFLFTILSGIWTVHIVVNKTYSKAKQITAKNPFKSRSGKEIYVALFGEPAFNCVKVINQKDQVVPRLDCCIWLEFKTCPAELTRVISLLPYKKVIANTSDTAGYVPDHNPRPEWFNPKLLRNGAIVLQNYNPDNPNRDQILLFSKDSTHAFYCDMTD